MASRERSKEGKDEFFPFGGAPVTVVSFSDTELELARQLTEPSALTCRKPGRRRRARTSGSWISSAFEDEAALAKTVLLEEAKRASRLGGDFYLADPRLCRTRH